ncbi:MAG: ATP-binding protein, partial [Myxococcales bacterium]
MASKKNSYTGADIQVLEGLEPVRKRPAMYIGGTDATGYHHLLWEILDNSVDEVINGYASRVEVTLHKDGRTVTVVDDGRGIPVDIMPKFKKPALEIILSTLHAGGKFEQGNYIHSGGLHGVGSSVVNALSKKLVAEVKRDGKRHQQTYARGKPTSPLKVIGPCRGTGTSMTFEPDPEIFGEKLKFDGKLIAERLEAKSYLHKGMEVVFRDETASPATETVYKHEGGIAEYLPKLVESRGKPTVPATGAQFYVSRDNGVRLEAALVWTEATDEYVRSYVNGIPTPQGGTHENGLRSGVVKAVRNYIETHELTPKGVSLTAEDIREGMTAILSTYVVEPQFQGQTKNRLNNPETAGAVDNVVRPALEKWLNDNKSI